MNIEEQIKILKEFRKYNKFYKEENKDLTITITLEAKESIDKAIETLLTAYEKEKEKNKEVDEFCRKELAFERRLKRENKEPDEFNQGRFYVSENIRKIIKEE